MNKGTIPGRGSQEPATHDGNSGTPPTPASDSRSGSSIGSRDGDQVTETVPSRPLPGTTPPGAPPANPGGNPQGLQRTPDLKQEVSGYFQGRPPSERG
jgi:hypothetical protein